MRVRATAFSLCFLLLAAAAGHAQAPQPAPPPQAPPPLPGFMPPYEISRIVRSAGFAPLAPPLREGTTYVLRATDFRGILMRVVVDARSGAIRAVNRIVPGPGPYGPIGMLPPPNGAPPSYGSPDFDGPEMPPSQESAAPPVAPVPPVPTPATHTAALHPIVSAPPPLPRPRPAELASRKAADEAKSAAKSGLTPDAKSEAKSDIAPAAKSEVKSGTAIGGPSAAPVAPNKAPPAPVPLND